MSYTKAKAWTGNDLKGIWEFCIKIDGVRAFHYWDKGWVSRNGKPLYNLPLHPQGDCPVEGYEVYCQHIGNSSKANHKLTITKVRAKNKNRPVLREELYSLDPLDDRLWLCGSRKASQFEHPAADFIKDRLKFALSLGFEGLIIRQGDKWLKVKPKPTYDVKVTGIIEGTGKHKGRMGALMTSKGKVGTGFTDAQRENWWNNHHVQDDDDGKPMFGLFVHPCEECPGQKWFDENNNGTPCCESIIWEPIIEVECMELTEDGKFRHPRFKCIRTDKDTTDDI